MAAPRVAGAPAAGTLRVLVADDSPVQLLFVEHALRALGHHPVTARNGREAVERCLTDAPDVVLLDIEMPLLDGIGACRAIRAAPLASQPTIVFVTATQDERELARCLEAGGDAFLSKPVSSGVLGAQLASFARSRALTRLVQEQADELMLHKERMNEELRVARGVFDRIVAHVNHPSDNVRVHQLDASRFAGDFVLTTESPFGEQFLFVGDCTGHGLPAALTAMPAASAFATYAQRGFDCAGIMHGINDRLTRSLPAGFFIAAAIVAWNPLHRMVSIWNGGLPDLYIWREGEGVIQTVSSMHPPLGVMESDATSFTPAWFAVEPGDRILVHTDGLSESSDKHGRPVGEDGVRRWINFKPTTPPFDTLQHALAQLLRTEDRDDIAVAELECRPHQAPARHAPAPASAGERTSTVTGARTVLKLEGGALRHVDPLPIASQLALAVPSLGDRANAVQVVIAELVANAVQHGVLGMESRDKQSPEGFAAFYQEIRDRLAVIQHGWVDIELQQANGPGGRTLTIRVSDSGEGYKPRTPTDDASLSLSGRGLHIVSEMADHVRMLDEGRTVEVTFNLGDDPS